MALITTLRQGTSNGATSTRTSGLQDPLAAGETRSKDAATRGTAQDMYFFTSIEDFPPGIGDLSLTHDDVKGFYDYVNRFNTPNGWYRDAQVGQWIYEETYDNYLDDYGFDAARVVYHSGHGTMDGNGVFWLPVGNDWGGDVWTSSNDMRLGNEWARYVFWSTCLSLRVKGGINPRITWSNANLGVRMIFGYETVSVDNGTYGSRFFDEWNNNKSFSTAFLDASWKISTGQEPSVVACGATQAEAADRVFNERAFYAGRANTSWWWWRWYNAARARDRNLTIPDRARSARIMSRDSDRELSEFADRFSLTFPEGAARNQLKQGTVLDGGSGRRLVIGPDGSREVVLAETADTGQQLRPEEAVKIARRAVEEFRLADDVDLTIDHLRFDRHAGASADDQVEESVRETHVFFAQVIDGIPVVTPSSGHLQVRVDNDGTVTAIADTTKRVTDLREGPAAPPRPDPRTAVRSQRSAGNPMAEGDSSEGPRGEGAVSTLLDGTLQRTLRRLAGSGRIPAGVTVVPDSTEIGYAVRDGDAVVVARQEVEVRFGQGISKRYVLEDPIST